MQWTSHGCHHIKHSTASSQISAHLNPYHSEAIGSQLHMFCVVQASCHVNGLIVSTMHIHTKPGLGMRQFPLLNCTSSNLLTASDQYCEVNTSFPTTSTHTLHVCLYDQHQNEHDWKREEDRGKKRREEKAKMTTTEMSIYHAFTYILHEFYTASWHIICDAQ